MNFTNILKPRLINKSTKARDQRTLFETVPMTVFPIPIVKTDVNVAAGVVKEVGITAEFPTTIWMARASPKARAIPKITAVKIPGLAALSVTRQIVCQRVAPMARLASR